MASQKSTEASQPSKRRQRALAPWERLGSRYLRPAINRARARLPRFFHARAGQEPLGSSIQDPPDAGAIPSILPGVDNAAVQDSMTVSVDEVVYSSVELPAVTTPRPQAAQGDTEEVELIKESEVDFLLNMAEQNHLIELEAKEDEYECELRHCAQERNFYMTRSAIWQRKFARAVVARQRLRSQYLSLSRDNDKLVAEKQGAEMEATRLLAIINQQQEDILALQRHSSSLEERSSATITQQRAQISTLLRHSNALEERLNMTCGAVEEAHEEIKRLQGIALDLDRKGIQNFELDQQLHEALENKIELANLLKAKHNECLEADAALKRCGEQIQELTARIVVLEDSSEQALSRKKAELRDVESSLAVSQELRRAVEEREAALKTQLTSAQQKLHANKRRFEHELVTKEGMVGMLQEQSKLYLTSYKDAICMLKDNLEGDELCLKLASHLDETLNRNEALELDLLKLRFPANFVSSAGKGAE